VDVVQGRASRRAPTECDRLLGKKKRRRNSLDRP
jgi:hypothetical protein